MTPTRIQKHWEAKQNAIALERVERAAALQQWKAATGGDDPRRRLAWLLEFAYREDLAKLPPEALSGLRFALSLVVQEATGNRWTVVSPPREVYEEITGKDHPSKWAHLPKSLRLDLQLSRELGDEGVPITVTRSREQVSADELQAVQRVIREALEALVSGRQYTPPFSALPRRYTRVGPPEIPSPPIPRRRFVVVNLIVAALPDAVLQAALELLGKIPPTIVRRCEPAPRFKITCGHVFIGERRQKYCAQHRDVVRQAQVQAALKKFHKKPVKRRKTTAKRKGGSPR